MKLKVIHNFHDVTNYSHLYTVGEVVDFEETRAEKAIALGVCEKVEEEKPLETEKKSKKKVKE